MGSSSRQSCEKMWEMIILCKMDGNLGEHLGWSVLFLDFYNHTFCEVAVRSLYLTQIYCILLLFACLDRPLCLDWMLPKRKQPRNGSSGKMLVRKRLNTSTKRVLHCIYIYITKKKRTIAVRNRLKTMVSRAEPGQWTICVPIGTIVDPATNGLAGQYYITARLSLRCQLWAGSA